MGNVDPSVNASLNNLAAEIPSMKRDIKSLRADIAKEAAERAELLRTLREMKEQQAAMLSSSAASTPAKALVPADSERSPAAPATGAAEVLPVSPRHAALLDQKQSLMNRKQAMRN